MGRMPDGWLDYTPMGKRIEGSRFITFKVPLMMDLSDVPADNRLNPDMLLKNVPNLGMIIDLTDTTRYYQPTVFIRRGLQHEKIAIRGRVLPPQERHQRFRRAVDDFLERNADNDKLIGVHCTHGCNRTGLMICTYLVQTGTYPPKEAIDAFESARGHAIHRDNYIAAINETDTSSPTIDRPVATAFHEVAATRRDAPTKSSRGDRDPTPYDRPNVAANGQRRDIASKSWRKPTATNNEADAEAPGNSTRRANGTLPLRWRYDAHAGVQVAELLVHPHHLQPNQGGCGGKTSFFVRVAGPPPPPHPPQSNHRWIRDGHKAETAAPRDITPQSWLHWQRCERTGGQVARLKVRMPQLIPDGNGVFRVSVTGPPPLPPMPPSRWIVRPDAEAEGANGPHRRRKSRVAHKGSNSGSSRGGSIN